jgi:CBS domain-containing protein
MLKLSDIMSRDVLTVTPETTVRDAMELFAVRHVSGAPVVADDAVVGVVSSSDLLSLIDTLPAVPTEEPEDFDAADGAGPEVPGDGAAGAPLPSAWAGPSARDGRTAGTPATDAWTELPDDLEPDTLRAPGVPGPEWSPLDAHTVSEAMTRTIIALPPDADITEAAALMERSGVHRVLVMDGPKLLGLVSTVDVARAVAAHRIRTRRYVFGPDDRSGERDDDD